MEGQQEYLWSANLLNKKMQHSAMSFAMKDSKESGQFVGDSALQILQSAVELSVSQRENALNTLWV